MATPNWNCKVILCSHKPSDTVRHSLAWLGMCSELRVNRYCTVPNRTKPACSMLLCCMVRYGLESGHAHRNVLSQKIEKMASGTNWNKDETLKLLDIWGQENVQAQLEGCKKNQAVYEKIAKELQEVGYERTYQQYRDKVKKLKGEYRKAKDKKNKTGRDNKHWDYFEPLDAILGHKPATQPPIIVDTAAEVPLVLMDDIEDLNDDDLGEPSPSSISTGQSDSVYTIQSPCTPGRHYWTVIVINYRTVIIVIVVIYWTADYFWTVKEKAFCEE